MSKIIAYNFEPVVSVTVSMPTVDECRVVGGAWRIHSQELTAILDMDYNHGNSQILTKL